MSVKYFFTVVYRIWSEIESMIGDQIGRLLEPLGLTSPYLIKKIHTLYDYANYLSMLKECLTLLHKFHHKE
jgi:hypothetical protein